MFRFFRLILAACLSFSFVAVPGRASAQSPARPVLVVSVAPGVSELDPASLRAAIGAELGDDAVSPDDPRAVDAVGTLEVSVDRAARALVVAYRGATEPITRTVDLPPERAAAERAAVLLAGNLARDEGDELAASLRKPKEREKEEAAAAAEEDQRALDRLGEALAEYDRERRPRETVTNVAYWTGLAGIATGGGLALVAVAKGGWPLALAGQYVSAGGTAVLAFSGLLRPGNFHDLHARYVAERGSLFLVPRDLRDELEQDWGAAAKEEHRERFVRGLLGAILGGASVATGVYLLADEASRSSTDLLGVQLALTVVGAEIATFGGYLLATQGPVESAWRRYERSTGGVIRLRGGDAGLTIRPFVGPTLGGGLAGLAGEF